MCRWERRFWILYSLIAVPALYLIGKYMGLDTRQPTVFWVGAGVLSLETIYTVSVLLTLPEKEN